MYNLIVGYIDEVPADRMLEYTELAIKQWVSPYASPSGLGDVSRLASLPTLVMPELQDTQSPQVARVGQIAYLEPMGRNYRFGFLPNPAVPAIASDRIARARRQLG